MTSNQLQYWRTEEEKRANRARETENRLANLEIQRANLANEDIKRVANKLEEEGLRIRKNEDLLKYVDMIQKYGSFSFSQLPQEYQDALTNEFGMAVDSQSKDFKSRVASFWDELKRVVGGTLGGGKGIAALF